MKKILAVERSCRKLNLVQSVINVIKIPEPVCLY